MPKKRLRENNSLPKRWRKKNGAYYYRVPPGLEIYWDNKTEFRLGKTLAEAHTVYGERLQNPKPVQKISDLMEKYQFMVVAKQNPKTQESKQRAYQLMLPVIGDMQPDELKPVHVNEMMDKLMAKYSQSVARLVYSYLSHLFSKAVEWGVVEYHPIKGKAVKPKATRRDRYVEHWELAEALKVAPPTIRAHIFMKMVSGLRRSDILTMKIDTIFRSPAHAKKLCKCPELITIDDLHLHGLPIQPRKTRDSSGKINLIQWRPQLIEAIKYALSINPCMEPEYLILTKRCQCYIDLENNTASGFDSLWRRWQTKALEETELTEKFQEKDLRAKVASDMDLPQASKLLGHTTQQLTETVYRRKGEKVEPALIDEEILKNLASTKI